MIYKSIARLNVIDLYPVICHAEEDSMNLIITPPKLRNTPANINASAPSVSLLYFI